MTTTPTGPDTRELLKRVEVKLDSFQKTKGEVVGERQLDRERSERKSAILVAVAAMSLITIVAVLFTVSLLRQPGPTGLPAPTPVSAQFVRDAAGCVYRVTYQARNGSMSHIDAATSQVACG